MDIVGSVRKLGRVIGASVFEYETQKVVSISSLKIGLIYRFIQLNIVLYIILWVMYYQKGYQSFDDVVSGVTSKLKGLDFTNVTGVPGLEERLWDAADYAVPPAMNSAFFVTTNAVITPNQKQGRCDEHPEYHWHGKCKTNSDCKRGEIKNVGSGIKTGKCVVSTFNTSMKMCEVNAWCPVENDVLVYENRALIDNAKKFTVMIKNSIEFPRFQVKRRNVLYWMTSGFLRKCRFTPNHPTYQYCPIFVLSDIIKYSQSHKYRSSHDDDRPADESLWIKGGMVAIDINWDCNLDFNVDHCLPKYSFRHLDDGVLARGNNFRYAHYYLVNGTMHRTLVKAYGIQFFISVTGRGSKFSLVTFTMNLGSGVALLGLATVLCDMIVLNVMRKRKKYRNAKCDHAVLNVDKVQPPPSSSRSVPLAGNGKNASQNLSYPEDATQGSRIADNVDEERRSPITPLVSSRYSENENLSTSPVYAYAFDATVDTIEPTGPTTRSKSSQSINSYVGNTRIEKVFGIHL